ncbi:MAG TPA: peptidylprolyl isomerase [Ktedonobacteraceae bacterium]|nr:peptidylprolyl isomerase [Ktedonobacteraceae bacterium]
MKSSTERPAQRPESQRSPRSAKTKTKSKKYRRQTAHISTRRDGKPLIFGWGKHLSHTEKVKFQTRATWAITGLIILVLIGTVAGFWIDNNIIIPGLTITSVNGHPIPQSEYRQMLALQTQLEVNKLYGPHGLTAESQHLESLDADQLAVISKETTQIANLNKQIKALPAGPSTQRTILENELKADQLILKNAQTAHQSLNSQFTNIQQNDIPIEQQGFTQSSLGTESVNLLQDDELIREWLVTQSPAIQNKINPGATAVNKALNDLKANEPGSGNYSGFLKQMGISDDNLRAMLTIQLRHDNMQNYLASQIVSPAYQVLARTMTLQTMAIAKQVLADLQKGQSFAALAKKYSQDTNTNTKGGDLGWLARGQFANQDDNGVIDNWLFDPRRTINEISPILMENGSPHILQILGIDPSRPIDASTLQTLKANALQDWLLEQEALPTTKITPIDQNMLTDPSNLPPASVLPAAAPASSVPGAPAPGSGGSSGP